jgi:FAD/FMN-containing dehydrogenase
MLGGGHGLLQGHYGLLSDNLVSARLVLPNATALTVSADSNPDLFWAIRGAGHNFGIVTEFTYKIYDVPPDDSWVVEFFIYTGDKVEALYEQLNILAADGPLPPELTTFSFFAWEPEIDTTKVSSANTCSLL